MIGLAIRASASQNLKNLFEAQNSTGTTLASIDKNGAVSAQSFKVAGTLLASTHLSDSALLARLASPILTGTPTAPTPAAGDNSTALATTAFVGGAIGGGLPSGVVLPYGGSSAPTGFLLCDGSAVSRTTYAALFALFSTTYGAGDGSTTFNLPDLRGRMVVGKAATGGHTDVTTLGNNDGAALASRRPAHYHGVGTLAVSVSAHSITDNGHTHSVTDSGHSHTLTDAGHSHTKTDNGHTHTISDPTHSHSASGSTGTAAPAHTHSYNQPASTANSTGGTASQAGTTTSGTTLSTTPPSHSHSVNVSVSSAGAGISVGSSTTGVTFASATTGITLATTTTGVSLGSATTGLTIATHTATPSGNVGTTSSAPSEAPAYFVLNYIVKT